MFCRQKHTIHTTNTTTAVLLARNKLDLHITPAAQKRQHDIPPALSDRHLSRAVKNIHVQTIIQFTTAFYLPCDNNVSTDRKPLVPELSRSHQVQLLNSGKIGPSAVQEPQATTGESSTDCNQHQHGLGCVHHYSASCHLGA